MITVKEPYHLYSQPLQYYNQMVLDIERARKYIYIETYRVGKDEIGERFRDALTKKAKEGVEVRILIDYWGAGPVNHDFFKEMIEYGGEVRFFEKKAKRERYYDEIAFLVDSIKVKLKKDKENDIDKFSDEIKELLSEEIVSRYYYQKGRVEASLDFDEEVDKAIEVLEDKALYASILDGTYQDEETEEE